MTPLVSESSRSGAPTLRRGGLYLHSRYDPLREAQRFVDGQTIHADSIYVLFCPGYAYVERALRARHPRLRVVVVQAEDLPADTADWWWPGQGLGFEDFLASRLDDCAASACELLLWPPAHEFFPDFHAEYLPRLRDFLHGAHANFITQAYFGQRWLRNALSNARNDWRWYAPDTGKPLFIAGSGPGLNDVLAAVGHNRDRIVLWSLPSSLHALHRGGVKPDCVVSSDAGFWAGQHLAQMPAEWRGPKGPALLATPRAMVRPIVRHGQTLCLYMTDDGLDRCLFASAAAIAVGERGTVAASAFELAIAMGWRVIFSAGLDFANFGLRSHARPHVSDIPTDAGATRLSPGHHRRYAGFDAAASTGAWHASPSLELYRRWFQHRHFDREATVYDYNPTGSDKALPALDKGNFIAALSGCASASPGRESPGSDGSPAQAFGRPLLNGVALREHLRRLAAAATPDAVADDELAPLVASFRYRELRLALHGGDEGNIAAALDAFKAAAASFLDTLAREESRAPA